MPGTAQAPPGSVQAGLEQGRQYGGAFAAGTNALFDRAVRMENAPIKGFWLGTQLSPAWGLEVSVRRGSTRFSMGDPAKLSPLQQGATFDYAVMELTAVRTYRQGRLEPYGCAGAGVANLDINTADKAYRDTNRASFVLGAGLRYWVGPCFAFRFDLRAHAACLQERAQHPGAWDPGRWLRTEEVMVGAQFSYPAR